MNAKDRDILALLAKIQSYSDSAKGSEGYAKKRNYAQKDVLIWEAVRLLKKNKHSALIWSLKRTPDQRGNDSHVLLVEFQSNGTARQMSFHCFKIVPNQGTRSLNWNKKVGESAKCAGFLNRKEAKKAQK